MLEISEIRKNNLAILVKRHGSEAALNTALGRRRTDCVFNQIKNGVLMTTGKPRALGSRLARDIEEKLGLEQGWMDQDHESRVDFFENNSIPDVLSIRIIQLPGGENMTKTAVYLDGHTFESVAPGLEIKDVCSCIVSDTSMSPALNPGDRLLIDMTKRSFTIDGVYLVELIGNNALRRLKRDISGKIQVFMDSMPNYYIDLPDASDMKILGRAIYLWKGSSTF